MGKEKQVIGELMDVLESVGFLTPCVTVVLLRICRVDWADLGMLGSGRALADRTDWIQPRRS